MSNLRPSRSDFVQEANGFGIEITQNLGLDPVGQHGEQQVPWQVRGRTAPEDNAPAGAQGIDVKTAQARDLDVEGLLC